MPEMPEWVQVWWWMRFLRSPQMLTALPQQGLNTEALTMAEYEELRDEWAKAGSPVTSIHKIVAVMSGAKTTYDDIPF